MEQGVEVLTDPGNQVRRRGENPEVSETHPTGEHVPRLWLVTHSFCPIVNSAPGRTPPPPLNPVFPCPC